MEKVGVLIDNPDARELLADAGADVDYGEKPVFHCLYCQRGFGKILSGFKKCGSDVGEQVLSGGNYYPS